MNAMGPDMDRAREMHAKKGYRSYKGPLLEGPRFSIDSKDSAFPRALSLIPDPPDRLYAIGNLEALSEGLAVIGARNATPYGLSCAGRFARLAAEQGIPIISGGAYGCDAAAHAAALDVGGKTVVFLGGGCDQLYPPAHQPLFQRVIDGGGVVVSEHEWSYPALPFTFRNRNRLIAGLARATLIVEAGMPSGTFSTADEALSAGKEVLVVPGSICSRFSAGSNRLLYQGATPIVDDESFHDAILSIFGCFAVQDGQSAFKAGAVRNAPKPDPLLDALYAQPMRMDQILADQTLLAKKGGGTGELMVRLAELEGKGLIGRYPDGRYGPVVR